MKNEPLSTENAKILADYGCNSWKKYVKQQAENFGVPFDEAAAIFSLLGESEAFDGFVTMLEDRAASY